jgi:hypothetical protein
MAAFERKVRIRKYGGIKVNENWRKRHNKEPMQLFRVCDVRPFVRKCRLKWIGHACRVESKRKLGQVLSNKPQGSQLRGRPNNSWWDCVQTGINKWKAKNWKER